MFCAQFCQKLDTITNRKKNQVKKLKSFFTYENCKHFIQTDFQFFLIFGKKNTSHYIP